MSAVGAAEEETGARRRLLAGRAASYRHGAGLDHFAYELLCRAFVQQAQASLNQGILTGLAEEPGCFRLRDDVAAAAAGT
jgi:hypothetical protein